MEFKGTKGNWTILTDDLFGLNAIVSEGNVICD